MSEQSGDIEIMLLVGDVKLIGAKDSDEPFALVQERLRKEDVVFGNLEGALYDDVEPYEFYSKAGWRQAETRLAPALSKGNFSAVGLANNVVMSEGPIQSTISILDQLGIAHTGAGMDLESARAPAIVERDGVKYGFLQRTSIFWPFHNRAVPSGPYKMPKVPRYVHGFPQLLSPGQVNVFKGAPGVATIRPHTAYEPNYSSMIEGGGDAYVHTWPDPDELEQFVDDVRSLRSRVDILVTSHHWRVSGCEVVRDFRPEIAHAAIDAGADLVLGHGTHFMDEGVEVYKGKAIFYEIGEFYFGIDPELNTGKMNTSLYKGYGTRRQHYNIAVRAEVEEKTISRVTCMPVGPNKGRLEGDNRTVIWRPSEQPDAVERLRELSEKFGTTLLVNDDAVEVALEDGGQKERVIAPRAT